MSMLNSFNNMKNIENESQPIIIIDDAGREKFWEDLGRPDGIISK